MKTLKKRILKSFLFTCLALTVATITFASMTRITTIPSAPGRPSPFDIEADWCKLRFKKPISDGGLPIQRYRIEYCPTKLGRWMLERTIKPQFAIDDMMQSNIDNRVGKKPVIFRVFAENNNGRGISSKYSDPITFGNPY